MAPSEITELINGSLYVKADAPFWSGSAGVPKQTAALMANKWVSIPKGSPLYAPASADLTLASLTKDMFDASTYHKGPIHTVNGVRTIEISYTNRGTDAGAGSASISLGAKHYPVSVTIGGVPFKFGSWGTIKNVTVPAKAVPISSYVGSTSG